MVETVKPGLVAGETGNDGGGLVIVDMDLTPVGLGRRSRMTIITNDLE
jgi:hypothetical protein